MSELTVADLERLLPEDGRAPIEVMVAGNIVGTVEWGRVIEGAEAGRTTVRLYVDDAGERTTPPPGWVALRSQRSAEAAHRAVHTLQHYFRTTWQQLDLQWDGDNDQEIVDLVNDLLGLTPGEQL